MIILVHISHLQYRMLNNEIFHYRQPCRQAGQRGAYPSHAYIVEGEDAVSGFYRAAERERGDGLLRERFYQVEERRSERERRHASVYRPVVGEGAAE